jgi:hypothetical protein
VIVRDLLRLKRSETSVRPRAEYAST